MENTINFGLVGEKLGHSISPLIHGLVYDELGIKNAKYSLIEIEKEKSDHIVELLKELGISGVNVTIPYKQTVMDQLDFISPKAMEIGAVNTITFRDGITMGGNTDYMGLEMMFEKMKLDLSDKSVVIMGNGGASKAVQTLLRDKNVSEITVVSISDDWFPKYDYLDVISPKDIIINTTPVGMYPNMDNCLISEDNIKKFQYAVDLIYNPSETKFLKIARENGLFTKNGLGMLVYQAIFSEKIWLNTDIGEDIFDRIFEKVEKEV